MMQDITVAGTETNNLGVKKLSSEYARDSAATDSTGKAPPAGIHEQVALNVISGKGESIVALYMLLVIFFTLCFVLCILAFVVLILAGIFGNARSEDIVTFFRVIASFDFDSSLLKNTGGALTDALIPAYALVSGIAMFILCLVFGISIRILKSVRVRQKTAGALLPGYKYGFVPSHEGIYKLLYINLWTKSKYYYLYPWESLSLYSISEKKNRICLKAGKTLMPLIPWNKEKWLFDSLKAIVLDLLPKEKQVLPAKKAGFRWGRAAIAFFTIIVLMFVFAIWLDKNIDKGEGATDYCDVSSKIHYSFRPAFSTEYSYFMELDKTGKMVHKYCELHGVIYVTLHPAIYVPVLRSLIEESKTSQSPVRSVMIAEMLTFPAFIWLYLIIIIIFACKPRKFRFSVL